MTLQFGATDSTRIEATVLVGFQHSMTTLQSSAAGID